MNDELSLSISLLRDKLDFMLRSTTDKQLLKELENEVDSVQTMVDFLKADMVGGSL